MGGSRPYLGGEKASLVALPVVFACMARTVSGETEVAIPDSESESEIGEAVERLGEAEIRFRVAADKFGETVDELGETVEVISPTVPGAISGEASAMK